MDAEGDTDGLVLAPTLSTSIAIIPIGPVPDTLEASTVVSLVDLNSNIPLTSEYSPVSPTSTNPAPGFIIILPLLSLPAQPIVALLVLANAFSVAVTTEGFPEIVELFALCTFGVAVSVPVSSTTTHIQQP